MIGDLANTSRQTVHSKIIINCIEAYHQVNNKFECTDLVIHNLLKVMEKLRFGML